MWPVPCLSQARNSCSSCSSLAIVRSNCWKQCRSIHRRKSPQATIVRDYRKLQYLPWHSTEVVTTHCCARPAANEYEWRMFVSHGQVAVWRHKVINTKQQLLLHSWYGFKCLRIKSKLRNLNTANK
jgi:hypothetical protein